MERQIEFPSTAAFLLNPSLAPESTSGQTVARTTYTFISQDGESASTKRVSQANRKKIRSRAMATVRADERRNGVKRPTKRRKLSDEPDHGEPGHGEPSHDEPSAKRVKPMLVTLSKEQHMASGKTSLPAVASTENPTSETIRNEAVLRHPPLPVALVDDAGTHNLQRRSNAASLPTDSTSAPNPNHQTLNVSGFSNPFSSSPDTSTGQLLTNTLLLYFQSVFVPVTFPYKQEWGQYAEMELMQTASFTDPASFYGLLTVCAAHRVVTDTHLSNCQKPARWQASYNKEYLLMKQRCIHELNSKKEIVGASLDNASFGAAVNLLIAALVVGDFDEARVHLTGLFNMVKLRGGIGQMRRGIAYQSIRNSLLLIRILMADTKCAAFLNCKPMFQFVLGPVLVPSSMQERIKPPASSELHKLGSAFFGNCLLSSPLVETLGMIQNILLFVQASSEDPDDFSVEDHDFFRLLNCQAEHRLLSYVCTGPATPCGKVPVHFIEEVVRTACICYLNDITIFSPPASGLGRRLTKHLQGAIFKCGLPMVKELDQMKSGIIAWASMVGAQGSDGQAEYPWFLERLTAVARMNEMA